MFEGWIGGSPKHGMFPDLPRSCTPGRVQPSQVQSREVSSDFRVQDCESCAEQHPVTMAGNPALKSYREKTILPDFCSSSPSGGVDAAGLMLLRREVCDCEGRGGERQEMRKEKKKNHFVKRREKVVFHGRKTLMCYRG